MFARFSPLRQLPWLFGCTLAAIIALFGLCLYLEPGLPWQRWHWLALAGLGLSLGLWWLCWHMAHDVQRQLGDDPAQLAQLARQIAPVPMPAAPLPSEPQGNLLLALHAARAASMRWAQQSERNLANLAAAGSTLTRSLRDLAGHGQRYRRSVQQVREMSGQLGRSLGQHNQAIEQTRQGVERALRLAQSSSHALQQAAGSLAVSEDAAQKMRELVDGMDAIAMQSTLLALDASVEAARADSASPSFGQMAAQMRDLAQASAQSSHQIRDLLQQSARQTALAGQTSRTALFDVGELLACLQQDARQMAELMTSGRSQSALARQLDPYLCELELQTRRHGVLQERAAREVHAVQAHCAEQLLLLGGVGQSSASATAAQAVPSCTGPARESVPCVSSARACPLANPPVATGTQGSAKIISFQQAARKRPKRQVLEDWEQF